jgi:FixJ family two-component response regulator
MSFGARHMPFRMMAALSDLIYEEVEFPAPAAQKQEGDMESAKTVAESMVYIVDDDPGIRDALEELLFSVERPTRSFASAVEFLDEADPEQPGCLLTDIRLPQLGGLELGERLAAHGFTLPVIYMSGFADIPVAVRGMKSGALDFLLKPLRHQDVLSATDKAIEIDWKRRSQASESETVRQRYEALSRREKEVFALILAGRKNREVADGLSLSEITVKIHRGNAMRKIGARNIQDLVRMDQLLGLEISRDGGAQPAAA